MTRTTSKGFGTPTANLWRRRFLRSLNGEVRLLLPEEASSVMTAVSENAKVLFDKHVHRAPDPQGMMAVGFPALLLAAHRELTARGVDDDIAFELLRRAFRSTLQSEIRLVMRLQMFLVRDTFAFFEKRFVPLLSWCFGKSFTWEKRTTDAGWVLVGTQCGFWNIFSAEGAPHLTKLVCEWDQNWMGALDASSRPIAMRRTMTLSTGSPHCEFHFDRAAAAPSTTVDVVLGSRP